MDYESLSDAELDKLLEETAQTSSARYESLSDAELDKMLADTSKPTTKTVQEMHPDFSIVDRLKVKNFAGNNEASVNYLQKQHPNLQIEVDDNSGQIKARARDGSDGGVYRVLDPDTGVFSDPAEMLRDIGDVGYDAVSGFATRGLQGLAGLAGMGVGSLPAASAAGAATGGGLEALRQGLGKVLGIDQEIDTNQIATAAAANAVIPGLFGTGATAKQAALREFGDDAAGLGREGLKSLAKSIAKDPAVRSQQGIPMRILSRGGSVAGKVGGYVGDQTLDAGMSALMLPKVVKTGVKKAVNKGVKKIASGLKDVGGAIKDTTGKALPPNVIWNLMDLEEK